MKIIKWEKGIQGRGENDEPQKNWSSLSPGDNVEPDMHVVARYKNLDIHLRIKEKISRDVFKASVMFFEPNLAEHPDDLSEDDEVRIDRNEIRWVLES